MVIAKDLVIREVIILSKQIIPGILSMLIQIGFLLMLHGAVDIYIISIIIAFDKSRFVAFGSLFCYLKYNEQGEIIGLTERFGDNFIEYEKSKNHINGQ